MKRHSTVGIVLVLVAACATAPTPSSDEPSGTRTPPPSGLAGSPSGTLTSIPSSAPTTPTPVPSPTGTVVIDYPRDDNERIPITLSMPEGATVAVRIASTSERRMGEAALDDVTDTGVAALGSRELVIAWVGTIGERGYELALADGLEKLTISPRPRPGCDLARHIYAVVLRFASDVVSPDLTVDLRRPVILDS